MAEVASAHVTLIPQMKGVKDAVTGPLDQAKPDIQGTGADIGDALFGGLKSVAKVGAVGVAAITGVALTKGWQRLTAIDTAKQKLLGLKMPAETVETVMGNALAAVSGTAYGLGDAATVAASAVAAGIKPGQDLEKTLTLVADASFISGRSMTEMGAVFNKVAASNKVQMDVINQLHDAGVPALSALAQYMGITSEEAAKLASAGKIDFETFQAAMEQTLGGAAQQSGATFSGVMDNILASLGRMGANLMAGFFPQIKSAMGDLLGTLQGLEPAFTTMGAAAADGLNMILRNIGPITTAAQWLAGIIGTLLLPVIISAGVQGTIAWAKQTAAAVTSAAAQYAAHVKTVAGWVMSGAAAIKSGAETLAIWAMYKAEAIKTTAIQIAQLTKQAASWAILKGAMIAQQVATGLVTAAQWLLNAALNANPIGVIILAITALVGAFLYLWNTNEGFRDFFIGLWDGIKNVAQSVVDWFTGPFLTGLTAAWQMIEPIVSVPVKFWATVFKTAWELIKTIVATAILVVTGLLTGNMQQVTDALSGGWDKVKTIFSDAWASIRGIVTTAWEAIKTLFGAAWTAITNGVTQAWDRIKNAFTQANQIILGIVGNAWNSVKNAFSNGLSAVVAFMAGLPGRARSALASLTSTLSSIATNAWNGFKRAVSTGITGALTYMRDLPGRIKSVLSGAASWLVSVGQNTLLGFINGAKAMANRIKDAVLAPIKNAIASAKSFLGIHSPSTLLEGMAFDTWAGYEQGTEKSVPRIEAGAEDIARAAVPDFATPELPATARGALTAATAPTGPQFNGPLVHIQQMAVRTEQDIRDISQRLQAGIEDRLRAAGGAVLVGG